MGDEGEANRAWSEEEIDQAWRELVEEVVGTFLDCEYDGDWSNVLSSSTASEAAADGESYGKATHS